MRVLLLTSNVACCLEDLEGVFPAWLEEVIRAVQNEEPDFFAIHLQEVGKDKVSIAAVERFEQTLSNSLVSAIPDTSYWRSGMLFHEDSPSHDQFSALGTIFFVKSTVRDSVQVWDFTAKLFCALPEQPLCAQPMIPAAWCKHESFPNEFTREAEIKDDPKEPNKKKSKLESDSLTKGFLHTCWNLGGTTINLVNYHGPFDKSNKRVLLDCPDSSVYSRCRRTALQHTLQAVMTQTSTEDTIQPHTFLFGDFNFRLDLGGVVDYLCGEGTVSELQPRLAELKEAEIPIKNSDGSDEVLRIEEKLFELPVEKQLSMLKQPEPLRKFDLELERFNDFLCAQSSVQPAVQLLEMAVGFPPSYNYSAEEEAGKPFNKKRCPAWPDRVLMTSAIKALVEGHAKPPLYGQLGAGRFVGDHKPIFLACSI